MKRLFCTLLLTAGFFVAAPAHAALIGTLDDVGIANALAGNGASITLSNLSGSTLTDLHTTVIAQDSVVRNNSSFYFTNTTGFWKQTLGTTAMQKLKTGTGLSLAAHSGSTVVVSNAAKSGSLGSFVYNTKTAKRTNFSPVVREVISGSFNSAGTVLVMVAKNGSGKQKLFVSTSSVTKVKEFPLPKYATSCGLAQLSTDGKTLFAGCTFNVPNQAKGRKGYVTMSVKNGVLGPQHRRVNDIEYTVAEWLSGSKLITIETNAANAVTMTKHEVASHAINSSTVIGAAISTVVNGLTGVGAPLQVLRTSTDAFQYSFLVLVDDPQTPILVTILGSYDTVSGVDTILVNDATFKVFLEAQ